MKEEPRFWRNHEDKDATHVKTPCAICKNPGNTTLYKCNVCGRWVCEWHCLSDEENICIECESKKLDEARNVILKILYKENNV